MATITTVIDQERGCGYRKEGGMYLMAGKYFRECGKLPIPLTVCPCCGAGIKPARGWTWVSHDLVKDTPCSMPDCKVDCTPWNLDPETVGDKFGLVWIGEQHYKTPDAFMAEVESQGISRRINSIPKDFVLGKTWVLCAHRKTINIGVGIFMDSMEPLSEFADDDGFVPGIFTAFKPERIEYLVTGNETEEELDALEKRGLTLVKVEIEQPV